MIDYKAVNSDETYEERVEYNSILDRNEKEDKDHSTQQFLHTKVPDGMYS